ncbi:hypothetical protein EXIGLDRAFT_45681 [Exidia glandulosa HHB12029]|uniref:Uncharacterized protein n=1 Tax=Exidia glandulosa HHB12029 TaxID=1314781 RepID=A0A165IIH5_EXIGL|nr:hypothetical protein EXIGLDRAFT_45681 [Exidia glandulosa HHB12029]
MRRPRSRHTGLTLCMHSPVAKNKSREVPDSAFGSPLTELGSPHGRSKEQLATPSRKAGPTPHTPKAGERSRLEVVLPRVSEVAKAGLTKFNAGNLRQTKLSTRLRRNVAAPAAKKAAPPDGGSIIEELLQQKRQKEANAKLEADAEEINRKYREQAQSIRDNTRARENSSSSPRALRDSDDDEADVQRLRDMDEDARQLLDRDQRDMMDTLVDAVAEDAQRGWCARVGYSPFWEDPAPDAMVRNFLSVLGANVR